jgi:FPC/CPF motif-containing protein YcgG
MTEQPPWPGELARELAAAWSSWLRSSSAAVSGSTGEPADPFGRFAALAAGYAATVTGPLRDLVEQQRELAESMTRWAELQRELAEQVELWAEHQRTLAASLEAMAAPLAAWVVPPAGEDG